MYKLVRKKEALIRKIFENYTANNFITKDISSEVSLAVTEADKLTDITFTEYNRIYYLLSGKLILTFDEEKVILEKGDSCFISANTKYKMEGTFKAIVINQPAFGIQTRAK